MQILWAKGAKQNLDQIEKHIAQDNPLAAINTVLKVIRAVETLSDHPAMGRSGRVMGTRELIISSTPYIVPYRIKKAHIEILRVLHGAMQWPEYL